MKLSRSFSDLSHLRRSGKVARSWGLVVAEFARARMAASGGGTSGWTSESRREICGMVMNATNVKEQLRTSADGGHR